MPGESDRSDPSDARSEGEPRWAGRPLELDSDVGLDAVLPVGEETVSRPLSEMVSRAAQPASVRWLSPWLMMGGLGGAVFGLASIGGALLQADPTVSWRGGLLAFDAAVILFIVRAYLVAGTPTTSVCHRVFAVTGLAAAGYIVVAALLQSAQQFIQGEAARGLLTQFLTLELLGVAGCIVFVQALRDRAWACRTGAVAAVAFLAVLLARAVQQERIMGWSLSLPVPMLQRIWPGLLGAACSSLGLALCWGWIRDKKAPIPARLAVAAAWLVLLAGATTFLAYALNWQQDPGTASERLWQAAVLWEAVVALPLVLMGIVVSWRRRRALAEDVLETTGFAWLLVALVGLGCLALWLVARPAAGMLETILLLAGVLALVVGAWIGASAGDWPSLWALVPAVVFSLLALCSLDDLVASARPHGPAWAGIVVFLWCCLVTGSAFAAAGFAVRRWRLRMARRRVSMWGDVRLISRVGIVGSALLLWLMFAFARGNPAAVAWLRGAGESAGALCRDLLALAGGEAVSEWLSANLVALAGLWSPWFAALAAGVLFAVLCIHLLSSTRVQETLYLVAALWWLPLLAATVLVAGVGFRLFSPPPGMDLETSALRHVAGSFGARLALTALLVGLLVRAWESFVSVMRLSGEARRGAAPEEAGRLAQQEGLPADAHLIFLVRLGVLVSALLLGAAVLACPFPSVQDALTRAAELGVAWLGEAGRVLYGVGRLAAGWPGHAVAAGLILYLLVALCVSGRRRRSVMPVLLVLCWVLVLGYLIYAWIGVVMTAELSAGGYAAVAAFTGLPVLALLVTALLLLVRWVRSGGEQAGGAPPAASGVNSAAFGLSSVGLIACVAAAAVVLSGALGDAANRPEWAEGLVAALQRGWRPVRGVVVPALIEWSERASVWLFTAALLLSLGFLLLHLLGRREERGPRALLCAAWSAPVFIGIGGVGYLLMAGRAGALNGTQLTLTLLGLLLLLRVVVALLNARWWLPAAPEE